MNTSYNDRFKDAPWYEKGCKESILVIGMGGIGSSAMQCLCKTIPANYYIMDNDIVNEHNIGTQNFKKSQVGKKKVEAVQDNCREISTALFNPIDSRLVEVSNSYYLPIMITCFDNMDARKVAYNIWKRNGNREVLIEARLRASLYEVYIVVPGREEEYEKTLFDDKEVDEGPCTFKQTAYFAMLCGARITHALVNYLTNKYSDDPVCELPFKIQEVGDAFYFEAK